MPHFHPVRPAWKVRIQSSHYQIGADAVIVSFLGGYYSTHSEWADEKNMTNDTYSRVTGTAIKYK